MSGLTPAEIEGAIEAATSVGSLLLNLLMVRRDRRPREFSEMLDELVDRTVEEVALRLREDEGALTAVESAFETAMRTPDFSKRRLLAQVAAAAFEDGADIDLLQVMASTIDRVDPVHVRVLRMLAAPSPGSGLELIRFDGQVRCADYAA